MSTAALPADEIQREMRRVRAELRDDVQELVASAQVMTDWHSYVRAYPWICVGVAAATGYFLIPSKTRFFQPDAASLRELVQNVSTTDQAARRPSLSSMMVRMAVGSLLQGGLSLLTQQIQRQLQSHSSSAPPSEEHSHVQSH